MIAEWRKSKFVINIGAIYVLIAAASYSAGEIVQLSSWYSIQPCLTSYRFMPNQKIYQIS